MINDLWFKKEFWPDNFTSRIVKNAFDFCVALISLLILSPFFFIIALIIKRDSPGPIFYWSPRTGFGGQDFRMLKFRTMYEHPSSYQGPHVTCKEDSRITPFGHWLRDSKVNELPQLCNVLIGQMSLVGPRPEDPDIVKQWPEEARNEILSVKPGITSPASILYHDEENLLSVGNVMGDYFQKILPDKMRLDRLYVHNRSFWSDMDILFWTVAIIIPHLVKARIPEGYLFGGPIYRLFRRYISWFFLDLITCLSIVGVTGLLWRNQGPLNWGVLNLGLLAVVLAVLFSGINSVTGLNHIDWTRATIEDAIRLTASSLSLTAGILILNFLQSFFHWLPLPSLPPVLLTTIGVMAQIGFITTRFRFRLLTAAASCWLTIHKTRRTAGERVIIVGAGDAVENAIWLMRRKDLGYAYQIIGIVDDQVPSQYGMHIYGCPILGQLSDIHLLIEKYNVSLILITIPENNPEIRQLTVSLSGEKRVRLVFMDKLMKLIDQQLHLEQLTTNDAVTAEIPPALFAMYDYQTGLPNQFLFQDRLLHSLAFASREHTNLAVLIIHLDGIEAAQSNNGKEFRKSLKREIVQRLSPYIRASDTFASLGENMFALILENIGDPGRIATITHRISACLDKPIPADETLYRPVVTVKSYLGDDIKNDFLAKTYPQAFWPWRETNAPIN